MRVLKLVNQRRTGGLTSSALTHARHTALLASVCAALTACVTLDDSEFIGIDHESQENTGEAESALLYGNGLNPNGWNLNGLNWNGFNWNGLNWNGFNWNGLHTVGLYATGGSNTVTSNIQAWLAGEQSETGEYIGLATMPYLVACSVPNGTSVSATVNGTDYTWPGKFGLAPGWKDGTPMSTSEQEWVSACLMAHVNLAGVHVQVSFRGAHPGLATTPEELASHTCREAAFMGNLFAGHATETLPLVQCHEPGAPTGSGRVCDPAQGSPDCAMECPFTCGGTSGYFSSCDIALDGTPKSYTNIITTYLPTDPVKGCLGWGAILRNRGARYSSGGRRPGWSWWSNPREQSSSCSAHCGGYTPSGASCAPDCAAAGTCAANYAAVCGTPPPYSGLTRGVTTCPSGYTSYSGTLSSTHTSDVFPSSDGYTPAANGTHHGTLLGPGTSGAAADFDLEVEHRDAGSDIWWSDSRSERGTANESIHYFYAATGRSYRWTVRQWSGTGSYKFCLKTP